MKMTARIQDRTGSLGSCLAYKAEKTEEEQGDQERDRNQENSKFFRLFHLFIASEGRRTRALVSAGKMV